jgi:hypothetical protein
LEHCSIVDIDDKFVAEQADDMADRLFGEGDPTVPQPVIGQILVRDVGQCPDPVLLDFRDVVDAAFKVAPSLQFGLFGDCLRT